MITVVEYNCDNCCYSRASTRIAAVIGVKMIADIVETTGVFTSLGRAHPQATCCRTCLTEA